MHFFNSDGSEPGVCGNGLRCLASFIKHLGLAVDHCLIESKQGKHLAKFLGDKVAVSMGKPKVLHWALPIVFANQEQKTYVIHSGVPHAVFFLDTVENVDTERAGKEVRFSSLFSPEGVNVNVAAMTSDGSLRITNL